MRNWSILSLVSVLAAGGLSRLYAQDEAQLRRALEGKRVTLQIDMPATADGVDVFPGTSRPLDFAKYSGRLRTAGTAYKAGESAVITKVKAKGSTIEIQLGGGGYGTFGDALSSALTNKDADGGTAQQAKIANQRSQALGAGSRFNLRYQNGATPGDMTLDAVTKALQDYASFPQAVIAASNSAAVYVDKSKAVVPAETTSVEDSLPKKGMSSEAIEQRWGKPSATDTNGQVTTAHYSKMSGGVDVDFFNGVAVDVRHRAASARAGVRKGMAVIDVEALAGKAVSSSVNGQITTSKYRWQDGVLEADFVNGILVAYRIASNL